MIDIAKKKMPMWLVGVLVYLSYCAMSWFAMRGTMAIYGERYGWAGWFANDVWAFFLGGLIPFAIYSFMNAMAMRTVQVRAGGDARSIGYGVSLTVITANIVLFALKFMYIALPLAAPIINIIIDPTVTLLFVGLYLWYAFYMEYVQKSVYRVVVTQVLGTFLTVYGIVAAINLLVGLFG